MLYAVYYVLCICFFFANVNLIKVHVFMLVFITDSQLIN